MMIMSPLKKNKKNKRWLCCWRDEFLSFVFDINEVPIKGGEWIQRTQKWPVQSFKLGPSYVMVGQWPYVEYITLNVLDFHSHFSDIPSEQDLLK